MIRGLRFLLSVALAAMAATSVDAATYIVPPDAEMIQKSDHIVVATGIGAESGRDARGSIVTRYTLRVVESLKGGLAAGAELVLTEDGGIVDGMARMIAGSPEYETGVRYLIFTSTNRDFEPVTFSMALGQFRFVEDDGHMLAVRTDVTGYDQNFEPYEERARDAQRFAAYIRDTVAQRGNISIDYFVPDARQRQIAAERQIETQAFGRVSYLLQNGGRGFRWEDDPSVDWVRAGTQPGPGDGPTSVSVAFSQWNSTASSIDYADAGVDASATMGLQNDDGKNTILFNDPNNEIDDGSSVAGRGGVFASHEYTLDGERFLAVFEGDVVMANRSMTQSCMNGVMTHEVGHTLGLRHSNQPPTSGGENTTSAIMNSSVSCGLNGVLQAYDHTAAEIVYGNGAVCNPPTITTHPQNRNVAVGVQTSLSVVAGGTGPFTYQWFIGLSGNTDIPVVGATSSTLSITPASAGPVSYWVRVGHTCDAATANSNAATVTATCADPAITAQPASVTITQGQSTQLQVTATGTGLSYQWYRGETGDRSAPVGSNSNKFTVSPSETTKYWVRVTGTCGGPAAESAAATVTVVPCAGITMGQPTATAGLPGKFTLSVSASSTATPLTFEWFRGTTPGIGGEKIASTQSVTVTVTTATSYWVRVKNACNRTEVSGLITVASCTLPSITTQPSDQTINSGQTANLSIAFSAGASVKWYRGVVGDKTNEVGSAANVTVGPLTETTQFWAEVSSTCGPVSSRQVTVTVIQLAELVPMLDGRFFVQVRYKNQFDNGKEGKLLGRSLFSTPLSETAVFTFGDDKVVELLVRVSDARPFDDNIHVFLGGLSDVEFFVVVTDSLTGIIHEYGKPANQLVGVIDRTTFPAASSLRDGIDALMTQAAARNITPDAESSTIRLLNDRFEVRMRYRNQFTNPAGEGYMNARSIASSPTTETAVFFFDENVGSVEWMVRFSDARPFANRIDLFHGGLSDVEFTIEVLDTQTGLRKEYHKGPFSLVGQVDRDTYLP